MGINSTVPVHVSDTSPEGWKVLTEFAIDPAHEFVHHGPQILIFLHVLPARHRDLDQDNLTNPLWVVAEEHLEGMQLLRDTLDIVQTVNADHELYALEFLLQHGDAFLDLFFLEALLELLRVDADRECAAGNILPLKLDSVRGSWQATGNMLAGPWTNTVEIWRG